MCWRGYYTRFMNDIMLVTGANRGLGLEVARQLAERGATVVLTARSESAAHTAAEKMAGRGLPVVGHQLDVVDPASQDRLVAWLTTTYGRLDALINNAAINYDAGQRATTVDLDSVRDTLETNLFGAWGLAQRCWPLLRQSTNGRIVNVSSQSGSLKGMGGGTPAYGVSKAALNALTLKLAAELRADRILVNAVCPGWTNTDMGGGGRPVAEGARGIVWAATLPPDGPTGGFFRDGQPISW